MNQGGRVPDRRDPYYSDEVTLRELYLILKRGLPMIMSIAVLAAASGFLWAILQPMTYQAEATVQNTPPPVRVQDSFILEGDAQSGTLAFEPTNVVTFETYRAIALSQAVIDEVTAAVDAGSGLSSRDLQAATDLEQLGGNPSQVAPLTVLHTVEWGDQDEAVRIANAWTDATVMALRASLLESFDPIRETTATTVASRRAALDEAANAWREFTSRDDSEALQSSLDGLTSEMIQVERRLNELGTLVTVERVRVETLETPLAELQAEQSARSEQLESLRSDMERIRTELSRLDRERAELARDYEQATEAYRSVARLQPQIEYLTDLAPSGVRVIDRAALPLDPTGPSTLLVTLLALVIGGMVGTLFVFLREAVRE